MIAVRIVLALRACLGSAILLAATYHVDSATGNNDSTGLSPDTAWRSLEKVNQAQLEAGDTVLFKRGGVWRGQLVPRNGAPGAPISYGAYGSGPRPLLLGSVARDAERDWTEERTGIWVTRPGELKLDVGNILFDGGARVGIKRWGDAELKAPYDYWYSAQTGQVKLALPDNPARKHRSIELALKQHVVNQTGRSHVVYESLAVMNGAAHGFGGASTHHLVIRDCDIAWIGGGHQNNRPDGKPVRYGNGIEFWSAAHDNLVEACRLWEIYDAALTNQGDSDNAQENITYRHNVIWNCEYSFEYWNGKKFRPDSVQRSRTRNILFEHNTCVDAGYGWGHGQRPDRNGRHLMFYNNPVETTGFVVRNNLFVRSTDSIVRWTNDWLSSLSMDHNAWFQPEGVLVLFLSTKWTSSEWNAYRERTRLDASSLVADPGFVDPSRRDYRLKSGSPASALASDGTAAGAHRRLRE